MIFGRMEEMQKEIRSLSSQVQELRSMMKGRVVISSHQRASLMGRAMAIVETETPTARRAARTARHTRSSVGKTEKGTVTVIATRDLVTNPPGEPRNQGPRDDAKRDSPPRDDAKRDGPPRDGAVRSGPTPPHDGPPRSDAKRDDAT